MGAERMSDDPEALPRLARVLIGLPTAMTGTTSIGARNRGATSALSPSTPRWWTIPSSTSRACS
jgi:hypothetical protein